MIAGETSTGFKFEYDNDDWELLELLVEYDENPSLIVSVAKKILGAEEYKALKEHCKDGGKVQASKMMAEVFEMLNYNDSAKN